MHTAAPTTASALLIETVLTHYEGNIETRKEFAITDKLSCHY